MQATAGAYYYYNNLPYQILNNPSLLTQNGALIDGVFSHSRTLNNNNNLLNPFRYVPTRNNRQQSSHNSQ